MEKIARAIRARLIAAGYNLDEANPAEPATLPLDVVGHMLQFMPTRFTQKILLSMTSKPHMNFVLSKITSYQQPNLSWVADERQWALRNRELCGFVKTLPRHSAISAVHININQHTTFDDLQKLLIHAAPTLKELKVWSAEDEPAAIQLRHALFDATVDFPSFPKLETLTFFTEGSFRKPSFRRFPNLAKFRTDDDISGLAGALVRDCPNLRSLIYVPHDDESGFYCSQLDKLKSLTKLESLKIRLAMMDGLADAAEELMETDIGETFTSKEQNIQALRNYITILKNHSPLGLKTRICDRDLIEHILNLSQFPIAAEALQHFKEAGIRFDDATGLHLLPRRSDKTYFVSGDLPHTDPVALVRLLVEHGIDLGTPCAGSKSPPFTYPLLDRLLFDVPSVEMFKLIFETKCAKDGTMTPFEYAQSLHPDYPFFWDDSLFSKILRAHLLKKRPSTADLLTYIAENHDRLLPIFGSEEALGGPNTPSVLNELSPIQRAVMKNSLKTVRLLVKLGGEPWLPIGNDRSNILAFVPDSATSLVDYLLELPSFDPNFIGTAGTSHLDLLLMRASENVYLLDGLLRKGVACTPLTVLLVTKFAESPFAQTDLPFLQRLMTYSMSRAKANSVRKQK